MDTGASTPPATGDSVVTEIPGAAVWATGATEAAVFAAMRDGRCYATSGERFLVDFHVGDRRGHRS